MVYDRSKKNLIRMWWLNIRIKENKNNRKLRSYVANKKYLIITLKRNNWYFIVIKR